MKYGYRDSKGNKVLKKIKDEERSAGLLSDDYLPS